MRNVDELLQSAAQKTGFQRNYYNINNVPTNVANITIIPFFGVFAVLIRSIVFVITQV